MSERIPLGAYIYPLTTRCPVRQERARRHGRKMGRSGRVVDETVLVQQTRPLFPGHDQPRIYCLRDGTTVWDDADEAAMAQQIGMAVDAGLGFWIFDSYEGVKDGRPIKEMQGPLEVFKRLPDSKGLRYAKLASMGSARVILPVPEDPRFAEPNRWYDVDKATAHMIVDHCVVNDWNNENYLRINGRPYLSFFTPAVELGLGGSRSARLRHLLGEAREYSQRKYGIDPYVVGVVLEPGDAAVLQDAGAEALTGYAYLPKFGQGNPVQDYGQQLSAREKEWQSIGEAGLPYTPPAVVGWDTTPRGTTLLQRPGSRGTHPLITNGSPELFERMLRATIDFVRRNAPAKEQMGIITAWNELGEGAALLPRKGEDGAIDSSYLDVVRRVADSL